MAEKETFRNNRIEELRLSWGLNRSKLASEVGISRFTVGVYERGENAPSNSPIWTRLADYFGVSVDYLKGISNVPKALRNINQAKEPDSEGVFTVFVGNRKVAALRTLELAEAMRIVEKRYMPQSMGDIRIYNNQKKVVAFSCWRFRLFLEREHEDILYRLSGDRGFYMKWGVN